MRIELQVVVVTLIPDQSHVKTITMFCLNCANKIQHWMFHMSIFAPLVLTQFTRLLLHYMSPIKLLDLLAKHVRDHFCFVV